MSAGTVTCFIWSISCLGATMPLIWWQYIFSLSIRVSHQTKSIAQLELRSERDTFKSNHDFSALFDQDQRLRYILTRTNVQTVPPRFSSGYCVALLTMGFKVRFLENLNVFFFTVPPFRAWQKSKSTTAIKKNLNFRIPERHKIVDPFHSCEKHEWQLGNCLTFSAQVLVVIRATWSFHRPIVPYVDFYFCLYVYSQWEWLIHYHFHFLILSCKFIYRL